MIEGKGSLPAVLFDTAKFLVGSADMEDHEVGKYIKLLCFQHQKGHLDLEFMQKVCQGEVPPKVMSKFVKNKRTNKWFNLVMEFEIKKRKKFSKDQQKKSLSYWKQKRSGDIPRDIQRISPRVAVVFNNKLNPKEGDTGDPETKTEKIGPTSEIKTLLANGGLDDQQVERVLQFMPSITPEYIAEKVELTKSRTSVRNAEAFFYAAVMNNYQPEKEKPEAPSPIMQKALTIGSITRDEWNVLTTDQRLQFEPFQTVGGETLYELKKNPVDNGCAKP